MGTDAERRTAEERDLIEQRWLQRKVRRWFREKAKWAIAAAFGGVIGSVATDCSFNHCSAVESIFRSGATQWEIRTSALIAGSGEGVGEASYVMRAISTRLGNAGIEVTFEPPELERIHICRDWRSLPDRAPAEVLRDFAGRFDDCITFDQRDNHNIVISPSSEGSELVAAVVAGDDTETLFCECRNELILAHLNQPNPRAARRGGASETECAPENASDGGDREPCVQALSEGVAIAPFSWPPAPAE